MARRALRSQRTQYGAAMSESIAGLTATTCALFDVAAPKLCTVSPHPAVLQASRAELAGTPIDRMLVYAPDAMGCHLLERCRGEFDRVRAAAPVAVQLTSVMPTVTPVCFASMFTGAPPEAHGIRRYEKPRLTCDTLFDALRRAGKRVAIVAVKDCSIDIIFRGRDLDYFTEPYDREVTTRALELIAAGRHEFVLAYHQEYDDLLHRTEPFSAECLSASQRHVRSFRELSAAVEEHWKDQHRAIVFTPDHGAHVNPETGNGTHGSDLPEDLEVTHYWGIRAAAIPASSTPA